MLRLRDKLGLEPVEYPTTRHLGASAWSRAADLMAAFSDPEIKAVMATIGGNDQITVLPLLDPGIFAANPKAFFGYSDNTNLLNWLWNLGVAGYHGGSTMVHLARPGGLHSVSIESLRAALFTGGDLEIRPVEEFSEDEFDWGDAAPADVAAPTQPGGDWLWHNPVRVVTGPTWGVLMANVDIKYDHGVRSVGSEGTENWLFGFGVIYLVVNGWLGEFKMPWLGGVIAGLLFAVAAVFTFGAQVRRGRGVRGPSQRTAAMYGWSWLLAVVGVLALDLALEHQGLPSDLAPLLWTGSSLLAVGLLYIAGGMLWDDRLQYWLGAWVLVTGAASVTAGVSGNFAVLSLAGGGGFLIAAAAFRVRGSRSKEVHA